MACISALSFCVAHRDFSEEDILVRELSKVKEPLSKGLSYFNAKSSTENKQPTLKDQVQRFLTKLSTFLNLSDERCLDLLVHYLAAQNTDGPSDEDQVQNFIADGRLSDLLNRIRAFYWHERLSLLGLFRVTVCDWHESWVSQADVLFAMTPFASRIELLENMLKQYTQAASTTESLLADGYYGFMRLTQPTGMADVESQDEFDLTVSQYLKEQLEMLNVILTGVHALCDSDASPSSCFFSKLLEAFWSKSFGLQPSHVQPLSKHRHLVDRICLTQGLILIRAANLDNLALYKNAFTKPSQGAVEALRSSKRLAKQSDPGRKIDQSSNRTKPEHKHFLYDAHLLNRLLASLSGLGDSPVHGPLLLFGAVCAIAFAPSVPPDFLNRLETGDAISCEWDPADDGKASGRDGWAEVSATAHLVAGQYAHSAIDTLGVFGFLSEQLTDLDRSVQSGPETESNPSLLELPPLQADTDLNLIDFCAHVAVFDLLCLLAQHVVLWTLDGPPMILSSSTPTPVASVTRCAQATNRIAYVRLFARALCVVAHYAHLTPRASDSVSSSESEASGIGQRIAGLIESLAEGFPSDLSLLHLCTALMVPAASRSSLADNGIEDADSLVQLVSELITALPYLTEPFTAELRRVVQQPPASLYPQLGRGDQLVPSSNIVSLTETRTVLSVDWRQRSGSLADRNRYATPSFLYAGVRLIAGTRGKLEPDLGWISWKQEYPVWNVIAYEVERALILLDRIRSSIGSGHSLMQQPTPSRAKTGRVMRESAYRSEESQGVIHTSLFDQLMRVQQLVQFMSACVEAQVHVSTCLYLMEDVWLLIQRITNMSTELTELWRTQANRISSVSIPDFLLDQIVPSVLQLLGSTLSGIAATGTVKLLTEHTSLWNHVLLTEANRFFPHLTLTRTARPSEPLFSLSASYLTGPLLSCGGNATVIDVPVASSANPSPTLNSSLLPSYLKFLFGLLTGVKWMCTLTRCGLADPITDSIEVWINQAVDLLQGGLMVTVNGVLLTISNVLKPNQWLLSTSAFSSTERNRWCLELAERSFILLTDLLTTHAPEPEMRQACTMLNTSLSSQADGTVTRAFSDTLRVANMPHVIAALQAVLLHLLLDSPCAVHSLLAFSSVPLHCLLAQFKALDQGLSVGTPSNTIIAISGSSPQLHRTRSLATVVWLGLTLVRRVLGLEHVMLEQHAGCTSAELLTHANALAVSRAPTPRASMLSSLIAYVDPGTRVHYLAILLTYLRYPFHTGLCRSAVTLLKWLTQHTPVNIIDYLSPDSSAVIRDSVLDRLASSSSTLPEDPLTRIALFDLIAEAVLASPTDRSGKRTVPILRFLIPSPTPPTGLNKTRNTKPDCLDCCMAVLAEIKSVHGSALPDQLSVLLLCSVTKLIAALYLQEANTYLVMLKSKSRFWDFLTEPMFRLLDADVKTQNEFSQVEHEYCGHVVSILGLELFCTQSCPGSPTQDNSFQQIVNRLTSEDAYTSWFQLVANACERAQSMCDLEPDVSPADCIGPILSSLYEATCRWKCLLMVHLDWLRQAETRIGKATQLSQTVEPLRTKGMMDQLIRGLHQLKSSLDLTVASDLANQLAVCLSIVVNYHHKHANDSKSAPDPDNQVRLAQLVDFLITVRPGLDEQARHLHADLLACASTLWQLVHTTRTQPESGVQPSDDALHQLQIDLSDCAFGYVAQLAIYSNLLPADGAALRQAISLVLKLWDTTSMASALYARLIQAGVFNNLLITLEQHSQSRTGAAVCHDILILVMRVLCADGCPSSPTNCSPLTPSAEMDVEEEGHNMLGEDEVEIKRNRKQLGFHINLSSAQVVGSYGDLLVRAFNWPPVDTLLQWIHEDELTASQNVGPDSCGFDGSSQSVNWVHLILVELRCLCLLHDRLGGLQQPVVARLLDSFCTQNGTQLQALYQSWCSPLYEPDRIQRQFTPLPRTAGLMHDGILPASRLELARAVGALYWRLLEAAQALNASPLVSGSGIPTIGTNVLYRDNVKPYLHTYGPNPSPEFGISVWKLTEWQLHCCSVLLQRFGLRFDLKPGSSIATIVSSGGNSASGTPLPSSSSGTPNKALLMPNRATAVVASPRRSQTPSTGGTPAVRGAQDVSSPQPTVTAQFVSEPDLSEMCCGENELVCLVRHLIMCLGVLSTQLPLLGRIALFTMEELQELRPLVQLMFNTPSLEDNSRQLTFGVLITLAHSLSYLFLKVSRYIRNDSSAKKSACELSGLLAQAHEMTVAIMLSQATLILLHEFTSPAEKQLLVRELTSELKSCNLLGRSSRRRHSLGHRSSHSPSSRSSSTARALHRTTSPHPNTPTTGASSTTAAQSNSVAVAAAADLHSVGTKLDGPDMGGFGFEQAIDRFAEMLRLCM